MNKRETECLEQNINQIIFAAAGVSTSEDIEDTKRGRHSRTKCLDVNNQIPNISFSDGIDMMGRTPSTDRQKAKIIFDTCYNPGSDNELVAVPWPEVMVTVKSLRVPLQTRKAAADYLAVYEALDPKAPHLGLDLVPEPEPEPETEPEEDQEPQPDRNCIPKRAQASLKALIRQLNKQPKPMK
ncbi:hypothetical protein Pelo_825 [Pelomyxa schiedti]|nr:hypothetical protein Pelo_825 [Pelomyxa schiedti]